MQSMMKLIKKNIEKNIEIRWKLKKMNQLQNSKR